MTIPTDALTAAAAQPWVLAWRRLCEPWLWKCRECGCTETTPCVLTAARSEFDPREDIFPCSWFAPGLCSGCA